MMSPGTFAAVLLLATVAAAGTVVLATRRDSAEDPSHHGLVDSIETPAVLVADDRVVDLHPGSGGPIDMDSDDHVDEPLDAVFAEYPALRSAFEEPTLSTVVEVSTSSGHQTIRVTAISLDDHECGDATLFLLQGVPDRERNRRELERRTERLDRFVTLVSHDLRNPLDVAMGRAEAIAEINEDERLDGHLEEMLDAHKRMRRIIDDGLALARQGRQVGDRDDGNLGAFAEAAWSRVETGDATLEVTTDQVILADRGRLAKVLENLFRNAVQHGGEAVTVEVGDTVDGFYVADDGVGIPPAERERVFEAGETSSRGGTGLGLASVRRIARAHGWTVSAERNDSGGASIEFAGVEPGDQDEAADPSSLLWEPN